MAQSTGFRVEGLQQVVRALTRLGLDVEDLKDAFSRIAQRGQEIIEHYAPKRTGNLASSVRGNRAKSKAVVSAGFARSVPYAGPINYGWPRRNITGAHFMQRGDDLMSPVAIQMLEDEINRKIRERGL